MRNHTSTDEPNRGDGNGQTVKPTASSPASPLAPLTIVEMPTGSIRPSPHNARTHPKRQIDQLVASITHHGYLGPLLVDEDHQLIAGHGRLAAAKRLNLTNVPVIVLAGLSETQKRTLMLADNKIAGNARWDRSKLSAELSQLVTVEHIDLDLTGFCVAECEELILDHEDDSADPADKLPATAQSVPVARMQDLFLLGDHRLLCGDARDGGDVTRLMERDRAAVAFTDPPYNLKVSSFNGRGAVRHCEFAMASGEMTNGEFRAFLKQTLGNAAEFSTDNAVHYVCMDWRHIEDLLAAGREVYSELLNLIAWVKSNAGNGSFYRSQHELIGVFRVGRTAHLNNVELGRHGRNRSNVWQYAGVNAFGKERMADLAAHPTVKPVAMIVDALRDCSKRRDIVLDLFGGSGSTLLACERIGRRARLLEYEPTFVDVTIRRWQEFTGKDAVHAETGRLFDDLVRDGGR